MSVPIVSESRVVSEFLRRGSNFSEWGGLEPYAQTGRVDGGPEKIAMKVLNKSLSRNTVLWRNIFAQ